LPTESLTETTQNTAKQNCTGLGTSYDTQIGNEVGFFYNAHEHTQARKNHTSLNGTYVNTKDEL